MEKIRYYGREYIADHKYPIPGLEKYCVDISGNVYRALLNDRYKKLTPFKKTNSRNAFVSIYGDNPQVSLLMRKTFLGKLKKGYVLYHFDGCLFNNSLSNLKIISRKELGRLTGQKNDSAFTIAKISKDGEVVEFYKSAREAGRENNMSHQTIVDRINGKIKSLFAPDGYIYVKDEEKEINKVLKILQSEVTGYE